MKKNSPIYLLVAQIALISTSFLWDNGGINTHVLTIFYTLFFCVGGFALSNSRKWLIRYLIFSALGVISGFFRYDAVFWLVINSISLAFAQFLLFEAIIKYSFFTQKVRQVDRISAGVSGYILLGLLWSNPCHYISETTGTLLLNVAHDTEILFGDTLYFCYVTLTTLGYGDIVPDNPLSKVLAILISLSGVIYLAVFISALVNGMNLSQHDEAS